MNWKSIDWSSVDLTRLDWQLVAYAAPVLLLLVGLGFLIGRRTGSSRARFLDLESRLELAEKEREAARSEVAARREEIQSYQEKVGEHFAGTSDLLRDLTLQYRAVYDHLAQGAGALCPDAGVEIAAGMVPGQLPEPAANLEDEDSLEDEADEPVGPPDSGVEPLRELLDEKP